jgi:hypothetical protein
MRPRTTSVSIGVAFVAGALSVLILIAYLTSGCHLPDPNTGVPARLSEAAEMFASV